MNGRRNSGRAPTDAEWLVTGNRVPVDLPWGTASIFVRESGARQGKSVVFLHGFPTSSWDWAKLEPRLAGEYSLLYLDFLGFGYSDKPRRHRYNYLEQADIVAKLVAARRSGPVHLVVHDYAVTVAQELLARQAAGTLPFHIDSVSFLNGAVYGSLHKALPIQKALRLPVIGWLLSRTVDKARLRASLARVFSPGHPLVDAEFEGLWRSIANDHGNHLAYKLIHYLRDRELHGAAWALAMEQTPVPLQFIWGMADPVSGGHVLEYAQKRLSSLRAVRLEDVGHYPQIEVPERVAESIDSFLKRAG